MFSTLSGDFLSVMGHQRRHIGDAAPVEPLGGCGEPLAQPFRFNVEHILVSSPMANRPLYGLIQQTQQLK